MARNVLQDITLRGLFILVSARLTLVPVHIEGTFHPEISERHNPAPVHKKGTFHTEQSGGHAPAPVYRDGTFCKGLSADHAQAPVYRDGTFRTGLSALGHPPTPVYTVCLQPCLSPCIQGWNLLHRTACTHAPQPLSTRMEPFTRKNLQTLSKPLSTGMEPLGQGYLNAIPRPPSTLREPFILNLCAKYMDRISCARFYPFPAWITCPDIIKLSE